MFDSERDNIPTTSPTHKRIVPGWIEYVEQYKQVALYWHKCWKDEGHPHQGETSIMLRANRAQYHRIVNIVKRNRDKLY
jgi:hypothetical protein